MRKRKRKYTKKLSLHPMKAEEALKRFMEADPALLCQRDSSEKEPARVQRRIAEILFNLKKNERNLRDVRAELVRIDAHSIKLSKRKTALKQSRACLKASLERALGLGGKADRAS